jgi:tRNA (adenine22-N1)-methyltransferase
MNKRLTTLANLIKPCQAILDIGSDHGLLLKYCLDKGLCKKGIASDINPTVLEETKRFCAEYPNIDYILSDGFKRVSSPYDTVVIAGMGSDTIIGILKDAPLNVPLYVQANTKTEKIREVLYELNFELLDENVIKDRKYFYVILTIVRNNKQVSLSDEDIFLGPILKNKLDSLDYYKKQYEFIESNYKIKQKIYESDMLTDISKKINYLRSEIEYLEKCKFKN